MSLPREVDVLVAGGGPAGSTVASLVAERGHRVLLVERSPEPRFKLGESLMPATYWTFERLGFLDKMKASHFPVKQSVQFYTDDGRPTKPFYFFENDPHESSRTWQVLRSEFDAMLLDHAAERGAEVRRGVAVRRPRFDGERAVGAELEAGGETATVRSRVLVDATGQSALVAGARGLRTMDPCLRHASFYTHYDGARLDSGVDAGATIIFHTAGRRSWFWFIPLPAGRVSVGVVGPVDYLVGGGDPRAVFERELERCPALGERLTGARRVRPVGVARDFSYHAGRMAGDGWVLVGDAFGFIDPIYSTGVFLALKSAELAADAICDGLAADDPSAARLGAFEARYREGMQAMKSLVYAFYDPAFSFSGFLERHPDCREPLVHMLIGNVFREPVDRLLEALAEEAARRSQAAPAGA